MDAPNACRRCGATLPIAAADCARCLFELALPRSGELALPCSGEPAPPRSGDLALPRAGDLALPRAGEPARSEPAATPAAPRPEPPTLAEVERALSEFDGFEPLGRGGMGVVFAARQKALDRRVALKVLPRALGLDPAFRERFLREARALARLAHPAIVAVHGYGEADGLCYLVMELVDGVDLRRAMRERVIAPAEALAIVRALCDALQYAHDEGVVHRDIKPENVLLDRAGRVKVADFGLAKLVGADPGARLTEAGQVMGTPHYMAPEQLERPDEVDHRADLFALGVVLYELLTGSLPRGAYEPPSRRVAVDVRLDEIVLKALEREPARRYQHALEVKTDVEEVEAGPAPASAPRVAADGVGAASRSRTRAGDAEPGGAGAGAPGRADPTRGVRGFALCTAFWIAAAALWNLGPLAFGLGIAGLWTLCALLLHGRLAGRGELEAELAVLSPGERAARAFGAMTWLALGFAVVALAHLVGWERSTDAWVPAYAESHGALDALRAAPYDLVRAAGADPGEAASVVVRTVRGMTVGGLSGVATSWRWPLFALGFALLMLGLHVSIRPRAVGRGRSQAWEVASDLAGHLTGSLVVLWIVAPLAAMRSEQRLGAVERRFTATDDPRSTARQLHAAFSRAKLEVDVEQEVVAIDERTARELASAIVVRAAASSPFDRWSTSFAGPRRETPEVWATIAAAPGASGSQVTLRAGLYGARSPEGDEARALLAQIEAALRDG